MHIGGDDGDGGRGVGGSGWCRDRESEAIKE
jgi:hypothetical protein